MGLLGGGEDSLAATSGWGVLPPINSSADWGSSSNTGGSSIGLSTNHWQSSPSNSVNSGGAAASSVGSSSAMSSSSSASNGTVIIVGRQNTQNALSNHTNSANANSDQLSSSPKPSSSWAQAAGKGLVNTNASNNATNGPSSNNANSQHDLTGCLQPQQCQQSSAVVTNANLIGGLVASMNTNANSSSNNASCSNNSAFQCSSNSNTGGLIGGSGSNPIDAAAVNKQRAGPPGPGQISDLIGQLSDDFRETLVTEKWGATVSNIMFVIANCY